MVKTKTTPRARTPTPVTTATKRPDKTKKFLVSIDTGLNIFDDQVSSIDDCRATVYKTFTKAYREAFADIWLKINNASVKILLQSREIPANIGKRKLHRPHIGQHPWILIKPNTRTETARQGNLFPHFNHFFRPGQSP